MSILADPVTGGTAGRPTELGVPEDAPALFQLRPFVAVHLNQPHDGPTSVVLAVAGGARALTPAEAVCAGWELLRLGYAVDVAEDGDA